MLHEEVSVNVGMRRKLCDGLEQKVLKWCGAAERMIEMRVTITVHKENVANRKERLLLNLLSLQCRYKHNLAQN